MKWMHLMLAAMLTNGLGLAGTKILTEMGLADRYQLHYLFAWYASGLLAAVIFLAPKLSLPHRREIWIGGAMALMSFLGQFFIVKALRNGAPGFLVYPIAVGANVLFVAVGGMLLFEERVGPRGLAGIASGLVAILLLSVP
jgi:drug/metabolite transporter (DMT)-like permease